MDEKPDSTSGFVKRTLLGFTLEEWIFKALLAALVALGAAVWSWLAAAPLPAVAILAVAAFGIVMCISLLWREWRNPASKMRVVPPFTPTSAEGVHGDPSLGKGGLVEVNKFRQAKTITGLHFRLIDLLDPDDMNHRSIEGKTFVNCTILGPACVTLGDDVVIHHAKIHGERHALVKVHKKSNVVIGAVGINGCTFRDCTFVRISFVGTQPRIDKWMRDWGWVKPRG